MDIASRMKGYEYCSRHYFTRRTPVILRLDGKAFHSYLRNVKDNFSNDMHVLMIETMQELVDNTQNCSFGYTQSDEISLLLNDWQTLNAEQAYGGVQGKIESITASMATAMFNHTKNKYDLLPEAYFDFAMFDCRAFNIPKDEVCNYFIWRQQDATINSVNSLGQMHFTQKQLHGKNVSEVQDMLMRHHDINWNNLDVWKKRGACSNAVGIDKEPPIFTQNREYIEQHLGEYLKEAA